MSRGDILRIGQAASAVLAVVIIATGCGSLPPPDPEIFNTKLPKLTDEFSRKIAKDSQKDAILLAQDYVLGAGDSLAISIFGWKLQGQTFTVSESGKISLPTIGEIEAGGKTVDDVKLAIETKLKSAGLIVKPQVSVTISDYYSKRVAVVGAIGNPGIYTLRRNATTLMEILSLAGGLSIDGGQILNVIRHLPSTEPGKPGVTLRLGIGLPELFYGDRDLDMIIKHGDTIIALPAKNYTVIGESGNMGAFPLTKPTTLLEALANAGGINDQATNKNCYIMRRKKDGGYYKARFDYDQLVLGAIPNPYLKEGDVLAIDPEGKQAFAWKVFDFITRFVTFGWYVGGGRIN